MRDDEYVAWDHKPACAHLLITAHGFSLMQLASLVRAGLGHHDGDPCAG